MRKLCCIAAIVGAASFSAVGAADNYATWSCYRNIVLNTKATGANVGSAGTAAMTHFPVLVRLSGKVGNGGNANDSIVMAQSAFWSTNGADIRFSKWDGSHLYYQRQRWDATNKYAEFWVLVDTVWGADSVNATNYPGGYLKMYWGNGNAGDSTNAPMVFDTTATPPSGTVGTLWGGGYQGVYHLTDTTEATWNGATYPQYYNLTRASTTLVKSTTGMIGLGDTLTGAANSWLVTASKSASPDKLNFQNGGPFTESAWVYDTKNNAGDIIMGSGDFSYQLQLNGSNEWEVGDFASGVAWEYCENTTAPSVNAWYHVVGVRNKIGTSPAYTDSLYVNDVLISTSMSSTASTVVRPAINPNFCVGTDSSSAHKEWYGIIDEVELSSVPRSHTWVKLCYENQHQVNASGVQTLGAALDSLTKRGPVFNAPATLSSYSANPASYATLMPITPNTPVASGIPDTFTVSPSLPAGLALNSSTGVITGAASSSAAQQTYTVTVKNGLGSASIGLTITVTSTAPVITGPPGNATVAEGASAKFIVTVSGTPSMNYVWMDNNSNVVKNDTTMNISDTLIIPNDSLRNYGASYTCTITNSLGSAGPTAAAFLYVATAPGLISPTTSASGMPLSPTLSWNTVTGASSYILQISTNSQFGVSGGVSADSESVTTPPRTIAVVLNAGTVYYWRVQSRFNGVGSLWSNSGGSPWQFTTVPAAPSLSLPVNTAVEVAASPTLTWNTVTGAAKYWIQVTTDGTFGSLGISDSSSTGGSFSPSLINGTTYYWRVAATNGGGAWSAWSSAWSFYSTENYGAWTGSRTFGLNTQSNGANVAKTQYGFPVLLRLSGADVTNMTGVQSNGSDIRFTKLDGVTHLSYQIESFSPGGGAIWVKMDSVQGGSNNGGFIMKWGNPASGLPSISRGFTVFDTTAANPGGGYQAVWHLADTTDATINGYRLTGTVKPAATAGGIIGACDSFNGTSQYLHTDSLSTFNGKLNFGYQSNFTLSTWAYFTAAALSTSGEICSKGDNEYSFQLYSSVWEFTQYQVTSGWWFTTATPTANAWHHVVGVSCASVPIESLYVDGVFKSATMSSSTSGSARVTTNPVYIGSFVQGGSRWWTGKLDEIEMANVARSSSWVRLSYENQQAKDSLIYRSGPASVVYRSTTLNLTQSALMTPDSVVSVSGVVFSYFCPNLPAGLSINSATGIISGTPSATQNAAPYTITASNPVGASSIIVTISVANTSGAPTITGQPASVTVAENGTAKFIVTVSGTTPMNYVWQDNSNDTVKNDTTTNLSDTLTFSNVQSTGNGLSYTCTITNAGGTNGPTTPPAVLNVAIAPTLQLPGNNALGVVQSPTLSWNSAPGASMYYLQVSTSNVFGVNAVNDSSATLSKTEALATGAVYFWRVQSMLNGVKSLWSNYSGSPWQFTTMPAAPALNSPVNTAVEVLTNQTLSWNTVTQATKYWIQITTDGTFAGAGISDSTNPTLGGTYPTAGLNNATTYYWRVAATNGGGAWGAWSAPWSFYTTENYSIFTGGSRTFGLNTRSNGANVAKTQYGFPVLLRLSGADVTNMTGVQSNGSDIRFTKLDGVTHLPFQIETFAPGGGTIWVKMDSVQGSSNNGGFIMKWGNASVPSISRGFTVFDTTAANPGGGYQAVWHLTDTTDATINGFRLTGTSKPASTAGGIIAACDTFNGTSQYLTTDSLSTYNSPKLNFPYQGNFTVSAWGFMTAIANNAVVVSKSDQEWTLQDYSSKWEFTQFGSASGWLDDTITPTPGVWQHIVGVSSASQKLDSLYVNGTLRTAASYISSSALTRDTVQPLYVGRYTLGASRYWSGKLDEIELSNVARTSAWVKLSYENQQANDSLTYKTAPGVLSYGLPSKLPANVTITPSGPTVTGIVSQYTVSPALPAGLSIDPAAGTISGTPTATASIPAANYTVTAQNAIGSTSVGLSIAIVLPPSGLTYATNPAAFALNAPIAPDTVSIVNPVDSFTVSGTLPAGLSLNKTTGAVTGAPTATQSATAYTITAKNVAGTATVALTISVIAPVSGLSYTASPAIYWQNETITQDTAKLSAGAADSFTISTALPAGLSFNKTTGAITGTPTALQSTTAYTVTAQNAVATITVSLNISVNQVLAGLTYGVKTITAYQGTALRPDAAKLAAGVPDSFTISPALPAGLSIDKTTGVISGTPTVQRAVAAYTVTAINGGGSVSASLNLMVAAPLSGAAHFVPVPATTTNWFVIVQSSINPTIDGHALNAGDEIGVFSPSRRQCVGSGVWQGPGTNLAITVYGEDVGSPDSIYGAVAGDTLYFKMWDAANSRELRATPTYATGGPVYAPPPPVSWVLGSLTGLSAPTPVSPLTGATGVSLTPTMQWASTGGDSTYQLQVSTSAAFSTIVENDSAITALSKRLATVLSVNTPYYWRVRAQAEIAKSWWDTAQSFITTSIIPVSGLTYTVSSATYVQNAGIAPNNATLAAGVADSFTVSPSLPAGLVINKTTGALSGTPSVPQAATGYTVTAQNATGTATAAISIAINAAVSGLSYTAQSATYIQNIAISANTATLESGIADSFTVSPALPSGLSIDKTTGAISGSPGASQGAVVYTVTARNAGAAATSAISITIIAAVSGLSYAVPNATFMQNVEISANTATLASGVADSFTLSPALPEGLSINKTTGAITGTPSVYQAATGYTVTAQNAGGTATASITITINAAVAGLSYSTASASYWQGVAISPNAATLAAGVADSFTVSPVLPAGLSLDKTIGAIGGTPTTAQAAAAYTVTARNAGGIATASLTIQVNGAPSGLAYTLNPATCWLGVAVATDSATLTGIADSFSMSPSLPSGLSLNTTTGSITGTPGASQAASAYTVTAWNPAGSASVSLSITINGPPATPVLALPGDNANTVSPMPRLSWNTAALAVSYHVQLSTNASFSAPVVDSSLAGASDSIVRALSGGAKYYWRVAATNPAGSSAWAADSFTVIVSIAIPVRAGWTFMSLNVHARDSLASDVMGPLKGFVLAKTLTQVFWPEYGIDGIDTMGVTRGYQMYSDSADTIKVSGPAVDVAATPIPLCMGWNLISYLPQAAMAVDSAVAPVEPQIVIVKDQNGNVYWPEESLNGIGSLFVGQGYQVYMQTSAALTYPATAAQAKRFAGMIHKSAALPKPRHFACALNTGSSATVLSKRTTIHGAAAHDSCEIGVYDGKGDLVGAGVVVHGAAAFSVWGKSGLKKGTAAGCDASEKLTFRLWDGAQEYPLEFHGTMQPQYANNAILTGSMVVPSRLFISKFALSRAYPNPFRENIRIFFDVPVVAGKELQDVEISVYDLNGSVVRQLANGKYAAGHYSVSWDGAGQSALGSNMYIVEMKASQFTQRLKLFRVK